MIDKENEYWECYLCAAEFVNLTLPSGYLSNSHPLCKSCSNSILDNESHNERIRLTYHNSIGDLKMLANIPIPIFYKCWN